jgi:hypothetical protein
MALPTTLLNSFVLPNLTSRTSGPASPTKPLRKALKGNLSNQSGALSVGVDFLTNMKHGLANLRAYRYSKSRSGRAGPGRSNERCPTISTSTSQLWICSVSALWPSGLLTKDDHTSKPAPVSTSSAARCSPVRSAPADERYARILAWVVGLAAAIVAALSPHRRRLNSKAIADHVVMIRNHGWLCA